MLGGFFEEGVFWQRSEAWVGSVGGDGGVESDIRRAASSFLEE